jgi:hypothetical protein
MGAAVVLSHFIKGVFGHRSTQFMLYNNYGFFVFTNHFNRHPHRQRVLQTAVRIAQQK